MNIFVSLIVGVNLFLNTGFQQQPGTGNSVKGPRHCDKFPVLVRVPKAPRPPFIDFNDVSLSQILLQVARSYGKGYIQYFPGIDPGKKGVLGWGHAAYDIPINEFCKRVSTRNICIYPKGDTLVVQKTAIRKARK